MLSLPPCGLQSDVIVGKTAPLPPDPSGAVQRFSKKDVSASLRQSESGMVDQVILTTNAEGQRFVKLRVRAASELLRLTLNLTLNPLTLNLIGKA